MEAPINLYFEGSTLQGPDYDPNKLEQLVSLCSPATFGKGSETVLDLNYRNALALDPSKFGTNFHPSEHGILETIQVDKLHLNVLII